ncbi:ABC transporter permease [Planctomyces sp. SH-PL62]|uniref:ABC transporter permease n=1 Tax=Planctomyces sp. SH-PL62 TaxID=1636152 RepID=UPI00078B3AE3|nr:ABC transporter permease subunit [Planctomyces sp. SH-PL62]AMV40127.1 ABC-2 family transporter protein [Planctomyces sp. SH-PL62]
MWIRENPVLNRELMTTLRAPQAFVLQFAYVAALGALVYFYWPAGDDGSRMVGPGVARRLYDIFFLGQFCLVALLAPTFAAGSITGEKERKTYEMLLVSPLRPHTILIGKLFSSLGYLVILILSSLPLMILCYLLGGLLLSEIARSYLVLVLAAGTFGLLSIACSSGFARTSSALVVSYLVVLPLAALCVALTRADDPATRDFASVAILPPICLMIWTVVGIVVNNRLLRPLDVGGQGGGVVDEEEEMKYAIGVVIDRDAFPDRLFAPAKRNDLMPDGTNPVLDKELRSEIFSQGTLMLRVVIQLSMLLSIPLMAALLFLRSDLAAYYVAYVLTFNLLVGPVFSAGSITQERERQTLALLLTTLLTPSRIVIAKLTAAMRVSTVLTFLLTEQILLAYLMLPELRGRPWTLAVFLLIIAATCLTTSSVGLMCSALSRRTSTAMVLSYMTLLILFVLPLGVRWYLQGVSGEAALSPGRLAAITVTSPYAAAVSVPMHLYRAGDSWGSDRPDVAASPLVQFPGGWDAPVWMVFLVACPILAVVFSGVAWLAFLWRWWRAGDGA